MLILDLSGSHLFGTRSRFKRELLAELAGMLAFLAIKTNDKVGAILFSSKVDKYIPPRKGASHVWRLIKEVFTYEPEDLTTNIDDALVFLNRVVKKHAICFLISDCIDQGFEKTLGLTAKKHDLTVLRVSDPSEETLPDAGLVNLYDPETEESVIINTSDPIVRKKWAGHSVKRKEMLKGTLNKYGVDMVDLVTNGQVVEPLMKLFEMRGRRQ